MVYIESNVYSVAGHATEVQDLNLLRPTTATNAPRNYPATRWLAGQYRGTQLG
jgi:hypothetical protein